SFFSCPVIHRDLPSFPTRRSSDLEAPVVPFPQTAIAFQPLGSFSEPLGLEAARPPLRVAAARNQAGALQHLQVLGDRRLAHRERDRKSTRLNSSHVSISYAVFCLK